MRFPSTIIRTVFLLILTAASACTAAFRSGPRDEDLGAVADFSLTDQNGRTVSRSDLLGKVWVASFIFTRCTTLCPQVSATLSQLQQETSPKAGVMLVSFTVDPDHDTPA